MNLTYEDLPQRFQNFYREDGTLKMKDEKGNIYFRIGPNTWRPEGDGGSSIIENRNA